MSSRPFTSCFLALSLASTVSAQAGSDPLQPKTLLKATAAQEALDVDGNGVVDALTDGMLVVRFMFGLRGASLIQGAIGAGATRTTGTEIEAFLGNLTSSLPGACTISASPESSPAAPLSPATTVQLTASCGSGVAPIAFAWTGGGSSATLTVNPSQNTTYAVTPSNSAGTVSAISATVYVGAQPLPPAGCSIVQTPNTTAAAVAPGTSVSLALTCTEGTPVTSCSWSGIASTACTISVTAPSVNTTYTAIAQSSAGPSSATSTTLQVFSGQILSGQNFCTTNDAITVLNWPASGQMRPGTSGFGNQTIAFKITIPMTFSPALNIAHTGFVRVAEVPGQPVTSRDMTVSKNACDFQSGNYLYNAIGTGDTAPGATFTVNNPAGSLVAGANFNANSGEVIYVNVRNANNGVPSCGYTVCNILFDFATPNRY